MATRPWDRLTGPEKSALVRQWNRYAGLLIKRSAYVRSFEQHSPTPLWGDTLTSATEAAGFAVDLAKARESYLRGLRDTWFRITFGTPIWGKDRIPEYLFERNDAVLGTWRRSTPTGQSINLPSLLDGILWEQHPSNLLDDMAEQAGKA